MSPIQWITFNQNGIPIELTSERDWRKAIERQKVRRETLVTVCRTGESPRVLPAQEVPELEAVFAELNPSPPPAAAAAPPPRPAPSSPPVIAPPRAKESSGSLRPKFSTAPEVPSRNLGKEGAPEGIHEEANFEELDFEEDRIRPSETPALLLPSEDNDPIPQASTPSSSDPNFWTTAVSPVVRYADGTGRATRAEFWSFQLIQFVGLLVLTVIPPLLALATLALIIPNVALAVRRLHDINKSGWLVLVILIPYLGAAILIILMLIEGTPGSNRFGHDPNALRESRF